MTRFRIITTCIINKKLCTRCGYGEKSIQILDNVRTCKKYFRIRVTSCLTDSSYDGSLHDVQNVTEREIDL